LFSAAEFRPRSLRRKKLRPENGDNGLLALFGDCRDDNGAADDVKKRIRGVALRVDRLTNFVIRYCCAVVFGNEGAVVEVLVSTAVTVRRAHVFFHRISYLPKIALSESFGRRF
jgi:hypothetical protein